jgi:hypothetical protein
MGELPNQGSQRTGEQWRFAAQWSRQRAVGVLPPPLKPGRSAQILLSNYRR